MMYYNSCFCARKSSNSVGIQAVSICAASLALTAALLLGFGGLAAFRKRAAARVKALMAAAMAVVSGCRRKAYAGA
jgi:hypothetical protein